MNKNHITIAGIIALSLALVAGVIIFSPLAHQQPSNNSKQPLIVIPSNTSTPAPQIIYKNTTIIQTVPATTPATITPPKASIPAPITPVKTTTPTTIAKTTTPTKTTTTPAVKTPVVVNPDRPWPSSMTMIPQTITFLANHSYMFQARLMVQNYVNGVLSPKYYAPNTIVRWSSVESDGLTVSQNTITDSTGLSTLIVTFDHAGTWTLTAYFDGNVGYKPSSASITITAIIDPV